MRIRTLIATQDTTYAEHMSQYISEHHADVMEVSVCNTKEQIGKALQGKKCNIALLDNALLEQADLSLIDLPLLLQTDGSKGAVPVGGQIRKHRRISSTIADLLERYAVINGNSNLETVSQGCITAFWSPCGGVGTTTAALAYAASRTLKEKSVFYLNLESFAATSVYMSDLGKSISSVFEMLESGEGNINILIQAIHSSEDGIKYLCAPTNFDDICVLSPENVRELIYGCLGIAGELVIDLSCNCDTRTRQVFELADKIMLITDCTDTSKIKLSQFTTQSNVYQSIKEKVTLIANKDTERAESAGDKPGYDTSANTVIFLPYIKSADAQYIYKTLAKCDFGR